MKTDETRKAVDVKSMDGMASLCMFIKMVNVDGFMRCG